MNELPMIPAQGAVFLATIAPISQAQINRFGDLHGTNGPSHTDPEYAKNSIFGGIIVQGGLIMAPVLDIGRRVAGLGHDANMVVETKFVAFARPQEPLEVRVEVAESDPRRVALSYSCTTTAGRVVQVGTMTCERA